MTKKSEEDMLLYRPPLSETSQARIFTLIEKCINTQRRLESAMQNLSDESLREATIMMGDTRSYRRILVEDLVKTYESAAVLENIRIIEKAMTLMAPRLENICRIAGNTDE
ncbi:unnamed protein product [Caenorhabditis sp. 36 PRJEB53466]|nr:unnamed protein product [Caenorhabditis sp. 36 PRJEB53466]